MCHKCLGRSTAILAAALAAPITLPTSPDSEKDRRALDDIAAIAEMLHPAMTTNGDPDAKAVAARLAEMGLARAANVFQLADYLRDSLRHVVDLSVTVMQTAAEKGDVRAIGWLIQNASELSAYGVEVQTQLVAQMVPKPESDDVSFMRPRGARPPVS